MSLEQCIALLGVVIASVALGYAIGKDVINRNDRPLAIRCGHFDQT